MVHGQVLSIIHELWEMAVSGQTCKTLNDSNKE